METKSLFATKALADARRKLGLNQQEMADLLTLKLGRNVSYSWYKAIERGTRSMDVENAIKVSRVLQVPLKKLWIGK